MPTDCALLDAPVVPRISRFPESIPLRALVDQDRRAACPRCGATATRTSAPGAMGNRRVRVRCSDIECRWKRLLEIDPDGRVSRVDRRRRLFPSMPPPSSPTQEPTMASLPSCLVRGCEAAASEGMLCRGHLALWRAAGRPRDVEAWALKHAQKRDASGELRVVPVRFPKPQRPEKLLTPEEHQRLWASVPDEAFEA